MKKTLSLIAGLCLLFTSCTNSDNNGGSPREVGTEMTETSVSFVYEIEKFIDEQQNTVDTPQGTIVYIEFKKYTKVNDYKYNGANISYHLINTKDNNSISHEHTLASGTIERIHFAGTPDYELGLLLYDDDYIYVMCGLKDEERWGSFYKGVAETITESYPAE